eukprot:1158454-Pelagomonas_calceolata.AAC.16
MQGEFFKRPAGGQRCQTLTSQVSTDGCEGQRALVINIVCVCKGPQAELQRVQRSRLGLIGARFTFYMLPIKGLDCFVRPGLTLQAEVFEECKSYSFQPIHKSLRAIHKAGQSMQGKK